MQLTVDSINWDWVKSAPSMQFFLEVMLEQDDADEKFGLSCYELPDGWSDSTLLYLAVCDAFPLVLEKVSMTDQGELLKDGLGPLLSPEETIDELGVRAFPEECYIGAVSPQTLTTMVKACNGLRLEPLAAAFDQSIPQKRFRWGNRRKTLVAYLNQWVTALNTAVQEKKGLLIHLG